MDSGPRRYRGSAGTTPESPTALVGSSLPMPCALEYPPQPLRRHWQLGDRAGESECIVDSCGDCGADGVNAALSCTLQAERIERRRCVLPDQHVERRHFARGRHEVIGEVDGQGLASIIVEKFLEQRAAYSLREPASELPFDEHRVDRAADVVGENITLDRH